MWPTCQGDGEVSIKFYWGNIFIPQIKLQILYFWYSLLILSINLILFSLGYVPKPLLQWKYHCKIILAYKIWFFSFRKMSFYRSMKNFVANLMGVRVVCLIFCKIWTVFGYLLRKNMRLVSFIKIQFHFFQVESRVYIAI